MGMANSKTRRQNHNASWSDLTNDVLLLITMKVGVVDFLSFSRVCKSWRLLALSNKNKFLASKPPMSISIRSHAFRKDCCYLVESDGRKFKTTLRHSAGMTLVGSTCGYLILYGKETRDFWLVNPITSHELYFPAYPKFFDYTPGMVRAIVVYSPSMSGWVLVMGHRSNNLIWFSIAGKGKWTSLTSSYLFTIDLHVFKGKIYTISPSCDVCELRLNQQTVLTLLETNNASHVRDFGWEIVSLCERLYVIRSNMLNEHTILVVDSGVQPKVTIRYEYLVSVLKHGPYAMIQSDRQQLYVIDTFFRGNCGQDKFFKMWYNTHDCMSVNIIH